MSFGPRISALGYATKCNARRMKDAAKKDPVVSAKRSTLNPQPATRADAERTNAR